MKDTHYVMYLIIYESRFLCCLFSLQLNLIFFCCRDEDMMSIASMLSVSNLSTIGFLEDDEDDDYTYMWVVILYQIFSLA